MGQRVVQLFLPSIEHYFTGQIPAVMPVEPLPADIKFVRSWITPDNNMLNIVYESEEWDQYEKPGGVTPVLSVKWTLFRTNFKPHKFPEVIIHYPDGRVGDECEYCGVFKSRLGDGSDYHCPKHPDIPQWENLTEEQLEWAKKIAAIGEEE